MATEPVKRKVDDVISRLCDILPPGEGRANIVDQLSNLYSTPDAFTETALEHYTNVLDLTSHHDAIHNIHNGNWSENCMKCSIERKRAGKT
jgi:hypothetical protein